MISYKTEKQEKNLLVNFSLALVIFSFASNLPSMESRLPKKSFSFREPIEIETVKEREETLRLEAQTIDQLSSVDNILMRFPPTLAKSLERKKALLTLDSIFHETKAPSLKPVQIFFHGQIAKVIHELSLNEKTNTPGAKIWKLYNHGFIVRTNSITIGFDISSGKSAKAPEFVLPKNMIKNLVKQCDILFISHIHPDHADLPIAREFIAQGKTIIAPADIWLKQNFYQKIVHLPRIVNHLQEIKVNHKDMTLKTVAYPGHQGKVINNVYLIETQEGLKIMHTGDQNKNEDFLWIDQIFLNHKVDLLFIQNWAPNLARIVKGTSARLVVSGHENELGHTVDKRKPYELSFSKASEVPNPFLVMTWGESYEYVPLKEVGILKRVGHYLFDKFSFFD